MKNPANFSNDEIFSRIKLLIDEENFNKLENTAVSVFGLGGVGGFVFEALVRSGIGKFYIYDFDRYEPSNINRQNGALTTSLGEYKTDILEERARLINPMVEVIKYNVFLEDSSEIEFETDIVIDCIDYVKGKINLLERAYNSGKKIYSSMGTAGRLNPFLLKADDISRTHTCPLAAKIRRELRRRGIERGIMTVFSTENPLPPIDGKQPSMMFVPSVAGIMLAYLVVNDILSN